MTEQQAQLRTSRQTRKPPAHRFCSTERRTTGRWTFPLLVLACWSASGRTDAAERQPTNSREDAGTAAYNEPEPPELSHGCRVPTLEQCQTPGFLEGLLDDALGCGALQGQNNWTCANLFQADAQNYEVSAGVVANSIVAAGVTSAIAHVPSTDADLTVQVNPDALNLAAIDYAMTLGPLAPGVVAGSDDLAAVDPHPAWLANGNQFGSCEEYAYEQFLEINAFWHEVGNHRHDYYKTYQIAFGPFSSAAAIGTHRLGTLGPSSGFLNIDLEEVYPSFKSAQRNHFFDLPALPGPIESTRLGEPVLGVSAPNLTAALDLYTPAGHSYVQKVLANAVTGYKTLPEYLEYFEKATVEGKKELGLMGNPATPPDDDSPILDEAAAVAPDEFDLIGIVEDDPIAKITGMVDDSLGANTPLRRLFLAEYDELFDLQKRRDALVREWNRLNQRFKNSGWTISMLTDPPFGLIGQLDDDDDDDDDNDDGGNPMDEAMPLPDGFPVTIQDYAIVGTPPGGGAGDAPQAWWSEETAARKAVVDELLELYEAADDAGCLESGFTYCEFSLKEFATQIVSHADAETQAAYEHCLDYLPSPFLENLQVPRVFIDPEADLEGKEPEVLLEDVDEAVEDALTEEYEALVELYEALLDLECSYTLNGAWTTTKFQALVDKTEECKAELPNYKQKLADYLAALQEAIELQEAMSRVAKIPELVDSATGEFKKPGVSSAYDNYAGGKYFGFGMNYEYRFDTKVPADLCDFEMTAGGQFSAYAKIIGQKKYLVDVGAWLRTKEESLDVHSKLLGINLFDDVEVSPEASNGALDLDINFVEQKKTVDLVGYTQNFVLGIIPMSLSLGAAGKLGYGVSFEAGIDTFEGAGQNGLCPGAHLTGKLTPMLGVVGFAEVAIDLLIVKAGIRGELDIIVLEIPVAVGATANAELSGGVPDIEFDVDMSVSAEFTTLSGRVVAFAEVGLGILSKRFEKKIVAWDGFHWNKKLFDQSYSVSVSDLMLVGAQ